MRACNTDFAISVYRNLTFFHSFWFRNRFCPATFLQFVRSNGRHHQATKWLRLRWSANSQCRFALCRPSLFLSTLLLAIQVRPGENIVEFWTQSKNLFPRLHSVFLKLCCVPASSAASERDFSAAGFILNNRRSSLDPKIVKDLMLIGSCHKTA